MGAKRRPRIQCKRAYEPPAASDGVRVLIDRMWPRGISKQALQLDEWQKELAPSTGLRKWFGHDPAKWDEFKRRYHAELDEQAEAVGQLVETCRRQTITLVFGARDAVHSNAVALKEYLERRL